MLKQYKFSFVGRNIILSILKEYGIQWIINRILYSIKLRSLPIFPFTEILYEKKIPEVSKIDLFEVDTEQLRNFLNKLPNKDKDFIMLRADNAIEGKLFGFSNVELNYGRPLNWQLNPITGKMCEIENKWFEIPDFDKERGDIKLVWEASRFSHFILFVRAYILSGNIKYFEAFRDQLTDWIKSNPYSYGANYKCGQECSIRLANAMLAYSAFSILNIKDEAVDEALKQLVSNTYRKILSNFFYAYKCIKNNHTFSELMGMIICAWCCGDNKRLARANRLLNKVICEQFTEDGGYKSYSFNYEREIFQDIECVLSVKNKLGLELTTESNIRLKKAILLMYHAQSKNGCLPNYGANDGTLVFKLSSCPFNDYRPTLNCLYSLITGKQLYSIDIHTEELIWFGKYNAPIEKIQKTSKSYPSAGLFIINNNQSKMLIVLNNYKTRPAHMDQMHIDMWVDDINLFCDAGTYSYVEKEGKKYGKNDLHNTVKVQDLDQMNILGPFMTYNWTKRKEFIFDKTIFVGTMKSLNGYTHKRKIEYTDNEYIITDTVYGEKGKSFEILFHTPCEVERHENGVKLLYDGKIIAYVICSNIIKMRKSVRSLSYLHKEEINCLFIPGFIGDNNTIITQIRMIKND